MQQKHRNITKNHHQINLLKPWFWRSRTIVVHKFTKSASQKNYKNKSKHHPKMEQKSMYEPMKNQCKIDVRKGDAKNTKNPKTWNLNGSQNQSKIHKKSTPKTVRKIRTFCQLFWRFLGAILIFRRSRGKLLFARELTCIAGNPHELAFKVKGVVQRWSESVVR